MKINTRTIIGMVTTLLMVVVLFNILPSFVVQAATATNTMFSQLNSTVVGDAPAAFATNASTYTGWFWVIGPFILVIMIVVGIFLKKGGYRRGRPVYRR